MAETLGDILKEHPNYKKFMEAALKRSGEIEITTDSKEVIILGEKTTKKEIICN